MTLVEVVMAIGVVSFALLALVGLLPVGLKSVRESSDEAAAINHLSTIATDLKNIPATNTSSPRFEIPVWETPEVPRDGTLYLTGGGEPTPVQEGAAYVVNWSTIPPAGWSESPKTEIFAPLHVAVRVGWPGWSSTPTGNVEALVTLSPRGR